MVAKLRAIKAELVRRKHDPSAHVGEWLRKVVQAITAVPGNLNQHSVFRHRLCRLWRAVLNRRSQRGQKALATAISTAGTLDSVPTSFAPLPASSLRRHASQIRAYAWTRSCGSVRGDQRWSSLPRQVDFQGQLDGCHLSRSGFRHCRRGCPGGRASVPPTSPRRWLFDP
jgi:hypothetical protein